jgi:hypothetical protein
LRLHGAAAEYLAVHGAGVRHIDQRASIIAGESRRITLALLGQVDDALRYDLIDHRGTTVTVMQPIGG